MPIDQPLMIDENLDLNFSNRNIKTFTERINDKLGKVYEFTYVCDDRVPYKFDKVDLDIYKMNDIELALSDTLLDATYVNVIYEHRNTKYERMFIMRKSYVGDTLKTPVVHTIKLKPDNNGEYFLSNAKNEDTMTFFKGSRRIKKRTDESIERMMNSFVSKYSMNDIEYYVERICK